MDRDQRPGERLRALWLRYRRWPRWAQWGLPVGIAVLVAGAVPEEKEGENRSNGTAVQVAETEVRPSSAAGAERGAEIEAADRRRVARAKTRARQLRAERRRALRTRRTRERRRRARALRARRARERRELALAQRERELEERERALEQQERAASCAPGYDPCVPAYPPDVDCADVGGPISVTGSDPHGLDADRDGVGCE